MTYLRLIIGNRVVFNSNLGREVPPDVHNQLCRTRGLEENQQQQQQQHVYILERLISSFDEAV